MIAFVPLWAKFLIIVWFILQVPVIVTMMCHRGSQDFFGDSILEQVITLILAVLGYYGITFYIKLYQLTHSKEEDDGKLK